MSGTAPVRHYHSFFAGVSKFWKTILYQVWPLYNYWEFLHTAFPLSHLQDFTVSTYSQQVNILPFLFWRPLHGSLHFPLKLTLVDQAYPGEDKAKKKKKGFLTVLFFTATVKLFTFQNSNTLCNDHSGQTLWTLLKVETVYFHQLGRFF